MRTATVAIVLCATGAHAFVGAPVQQMGRASSTRPQAGAAQPLSMSGEGAKISKRPKKAIVIEQVAEMLGKSTMVFSIPSSNIGANDVVRLRKDMPDGCTARVVKNKLMRIACKGTDFEHLSEVTTGENFWMFIEGDDNLAAPIKYIQEFSKSVDKEKADWKEPIRAGVFDGSVLDGPGVLAISKLPTKQELMQRLAIALNSVPTKLGRSIKLVPTKVGRVVRLAFAEGSGEEEAAAPEAEAAEEAPAAADAEAVAAPEAEAAAPPVGDAEPEAEATPAAE